MTQHVVNFSGGIVSWAMAKRVAERYGTGSLTLLFADTRMEDEDLYRFLGQASANIGVPLTQIADGRTPWEVFNDEGMLGNDRADPCSRILKRELLDRWHRANCSPSDTRIYIGISWDEAHRRDAIRRRLHPWHVEFPMCEPPYYTKDELLGRLRAEGIDPPRLYGLGFPHNNCGGFCVKGGHSSFALLLRTMPERYAYHESQEEALRERLGKDVAILTDRRGGGPRRPLTLRELRERLQRNEYVSLFDWGSCLCFAEVPR